MEQEHVHLDLNGPIATVTLARPEKRNALGLDVMRSVVENLERLPSDIGVVITAAEGTAFSAGHDLSEMIGRPDDYYAELSARAAR